MHHDTASDGDVVRQGYCELAPESVDELVQKLEKTKAIVKDLQSKLDSFYATSSEHIRTVELDKIAESIVRGMRQAVVTAVVDHITEKSQTTSPTPGEKTMLDTLRTLQSKKNPHANYQREKVIEQFIGHHAENLSKKIRETFIESSHMFDGADNIRSIFNDSRLKPKHIEGTLGRAAEMHNGITREQVKKNGGKFLFVYEGKIHRVTISRQPTNAQYDNTEIRERRMTNVRALKLWEKSFLFVDNNKRPIEIASNLRMTKAEHHGMLFTPNTTVKPWNSPPTPQKKPSLPDRARSPPPRARVQQTPTKATSETQQQASNSSS